MAAGSYAATGKVIPGPLQAIRGYQRDGLHTFGLDVAGMPPCRPDDIRRHALWAAYKAADSVYLPRPHAVTTTTVTTLADPVATLEAQAMWADKLTDHHAAAEVVFGNGGAAEVVSHLGGHWLEFVAADFAILSLG